MLDIKNLYYDTETDKRIEAAVKQYPLNKHFLMRDRSQTAILHVLADIDENDSSVTILFTGGSALQKAYNLIPRGSEDIDINVIINDPMSDLMAENIKEDLIEKTFDRLERTGKLKVDRTPKTEYRQGQKIQGMGKSPLRFRSYNIGIPETHEIEAYNQGEGASMQSKVKLDITFISENEIRGIAHKHINTIVGSRESGFQMKCVNVFDILSGKLGAASTKYMLKGKFKKEKRQISDKPIYRPEDMRHMYDIAYVYPKLSAEEKKSFIEAGGEVIKKDALDNRDHGYLTGLDGKERLIGGYKKLADEANEFRQDYDTAIGKFPKIDPEVNFSFDDALEGYAQVVTDIIGEDVTRY